MARTIDVPINITAQPGLDDYIRMCVEDSKRWFPTTSIDNEDRGASLMHHLVALVGEVGELCNIVKKVDRGSTTWDAVEEDAAFELVDVFIYLCTLAGLMGVSLEWLFNQKRIQNEERFGPNASSPDSTDLAARVHDKQQAPLGAASVVGVGEVLEFLPAEES